MMCYSPITLTNDNYYLKNGRMLKDKTFVKVPCGRCLACQSQKSAEWTMRLSHEWLYYKQDRTMFITLTYDKEHCPKHYSLSVRDCQLYFKRLRKAGYKFKYLLAGEYGSRYGRPHYHAILYGISNLNIYRKVNKKDKAKTKIDYDLWRLWKNGGISIGTCSNKSIQYCSQYSLKCINNHLDRKTYFNCFGGEKHFRLFSKGIGKRYAIDNAYNLYENLSINFSDSIRSIPRYYIKIIVKNFNLDILDKLREKMYIEKDEEIKQLYAHFGLTPKSAFDFYRFEDYFDIEKHDKLRKIYNNRLTLKRVKYEIRHKQYIYNKLDFINLGIEEEIA